MCCAAASILPTRTHRDLVRDAVALLLRKGIERTAELGHQGCEAPAEGIGGGELKVDIDTVETIVLNELNSAGDERSTLPSIGDEAEVSRLRVGPASHGEQNLEVPDGLG